jgi:hypothetical protein
MKNNVAVTSFDLDSTAGRLRTSYGIDSNRRGLFVFLQYQNNITNICRLVKDQVGLTGGKMEVLPGRSSWKICKTMGSFLERTMSRQRRLGHFIRHCRSLLAWCSRNSRSDSRTIGYKPIRNSESRKETCKHLFTIGHYIPDKGIMSTVNQSLTCRKQNYCSARMYETAFTLQWSRALSKRRDKNTPFSSQGSSSTEFTRKFAYRSTSTTWS